MTLTVGSLIVAASLAVSPSAADKSQEDAVKKELKKFEGKWTLVSREINGKDALGDEFKRFKIIYDDAGRVTVEKDNAVIARATVTIDPTKKPATMDITYMQGDCKGKTYRAIYKIADDTYTICLSPTGRERPQDFASKPDSNVILETLKREKP
jgi:uncharacterized protein (TIGR03067 family)